MKKLKVNWPLVVAVAVAVSLVSCHNTKVAEQHEENLIQINKVKFEETFNRADFTLPEVELEEIIIPEELEEEAGFSK